MNAYSNKKGTFMEFENISLKEGIRLSRDKENYILMDVREKDRYKEGHRIRGQLSLWDLKRML